MEKNIPTILEKIIQQKVKEVEEGSKVNSISLMEGIIAETPEEPRYFFETLNKRKQVGQFGVIAEIKKASPSKGLICESFDPAQIAMSYEQSGAACLSVLTDEQFFQGSSIYLEEAREATQLPVLRKDFIISEYQIYESKIMGADCILLIAACLTHQELLNFTRLAHDLSLDVLVEVHNMDDLNKVAGVPTRMIGINNRDLHSFNVDLSVTMELSTQIPPDTLIITESGILKREDVDLIAGAGITTFLVGEAFMREEKPGDKLAEMFAC